VPIDSRVVGQSHPNHIIASNRVTALRHNSSILFTLKRAKPLSASAAWPNREKVCTTILPMCSSLTIDKKTNRDEKQPCPCYRPCFFPCSGRLYQNPQSLGEQMANGTSTMKSIQPIICRSEYQRNFRAGVTTGGSTMMVNLCPRLRPHSRSWRDNSTSSAA